MKISHYCHICNASGTFTLEDIFFEIIPQDLILDAKCSKGHSSLIRLSNPIYTLLFDNAIKAYCTKNYRGCIFEASSALERFYEQVIRLLLIGKNNLENKELIKKYYSAWKVIKNQSERQMGAFIMLFFNLTHKNPLLISDKLVSLRNNTIHKGYFPIESEAFNFLVAAFDVIQVNRLIIREKNEDVFLLLNQRIDFENYINPIDEDGNEKYIMDLYGEHFFNSCFGIDFKDNIQNYYTQCLSNNSQKR